MKRLLALSIFAALAILLVSSDFAALSDYSAAPPNDTALPETGMNFASDEILVKFSPGAGPSEVAEIHRQCGGQIKETIPSIGVQVVTIPAGKATEKARSYSAHAEVLYAEPDYLAEAIGSPDDAFFDNQWGMMKVEAGAAWDVTQGSSSVKIAVLDTGVDIDHPDLAGKLVSVVDFTASTAGGDDVYGHGTHVAGIAAAITNNGTGVAGLGYSSSVMCVKVVRDDGIGSYSSIAQGIIWAADNGAQVINMSLGGGSGSSTLQDAVNYAWGKGVVIVAAAGNYGSSTAFYPAYYPNVIAVAATDVNDNLTSWSNYGDWVDVAAPGVDIFSTLKGGAYGNMRGTSMASPHVAGLAALLYTVVADSNGDGRLNDEVRAQIEAAADPIASSGAGNGRINAYKAVISSAPVPGTIAGKVVDANDGSAIAGAAISDGIRSTITDAGGNYAIGDVWPGSYTVMASKDGYQPSSLVISMASAQESTADLALAKSVPVVETVWVDSITFSTQGKSLAIQVRVSGTNGAVPGAAVEMDLSSSGGQIWHFSGTADSSGAVSFVVSKRSGTTYVATVTRIAASGYTWDVGSGVNSSSYTVSGSSKTVRK